LPSLFFSLFFAFLPQATAGKLNLVNGRKNGLNYFHAISKPKKEKKTVPKYSSHALSLKSL